jgi:hypothetical protein
MKSLWQKWKWYLVPILLVATPPGLLMLFQVSWRVAKNYDFNARTNVALATDVTAIEYQPNTDWPIYVTKDPTRIEGVKLWLRSSSEVVFWRHPSPPTCCNLRVVFRDGAALDVPISAFRAPRADPQRIVAPEVTFALEGHLRVGTLHELQQLLPADGS